MNDDMEIEAVLEVDQPATLASGWRVHRWTGEFIYRIDSRVVSLEEFHLERQRRSDTRLPPSSL